MSKSIEKVILNEVKQSLLAYDIDSMLDEKTIKKLVETEVHKQIEAIISERIKVGMMEKIQKKYPILDYYMAHEVDKILTKIEAL